MCISVFCTILTQTAIISLHAFYRLVFLMEVNYVLCDVWTESSSTIKIKFSLQREMSHYIMNDTERICNAVGKTEKILNVSSPHRHAHPNRRTISVANHPSGSYATTVPHTTSITPVKTIFNEMKWRLYGANAVATWSRPLTCTTSPKSDA